MLCFATTECDAETIWVDANGNWFEAANWSDGVPDLTVGAQINNGGTARIDFGGAATADITALGTFLGDSGNLSLDRASSLATNIIHVGFEGTGSLTITNGSTLLDGGGAIATLRGSTGIAVVDGLGSTWTNLQALEVGVHGSGTLIVTNGGTVTAPLVVIGDGFLGVNDSNTSGTVIVNGNGSQMAVATQLIIGQVVPGSLAITNGGLVSNREAVLGSVSTSIGVVSVDGAGSAWINSEHLTIGGNGTGILTITNGGSVANTFGAIGSGASIIKFGTSGTVMVDGAGSTWTNTTGLVVGQSETGTLKITNGGLVSSTDSVVASNPGSVGTVTVDGATSTWANSGDLRIGHQGIGTVEISNGGSVSSSHGFIGGTFLGLLVGPSGLVRVDGAGSNWTNSGELFVGYFSNGTLSITDGGAVSSTDGYVGYVGTGIAVVDGADSIWVNSGQLTVGYRGRSGTLNISNGGTVSSGEGIVGLGFSGDNDNSPQLAAVTVSGQGSTWNIDGGLYVGGSSQGPGVPGLLRVENGGGVNTLSTQIWKTGTLELGFNATLRTPLLTFTGGTLRTIASITFSNNAVLAGPGVIVDSNGFDSILSGVLSGDGGLTKDGAGTIKLNNAETYSGETRVNAGSLIVNGSIASPVSFVGPAGLLGGNAVLGGNLVSSGSISPGDSGPGRLTVNGSYTQSNGATLQLEIGGLAFVQHDLLQANGTAQLDGTLQILRLNNFHFLPGDKVTFLSAAGGVTGTFSTVVNPFNDTIVLTRVVYEGNQVSLEAFQGSFASLPGLTFNEHAVANHLDTVVGDPREAELIAFLNTELLRYLPQDYDLIAPDELTAIYEVVFSHGTTEWLNLQRRMAEVRAGSTGFSANGLNLRGGGKTSVTSASGDKPAAVFQPSPENRWGVFVRGDGEFLRIGDEDSNAPGYDISTGGVTLGLDFRPSPNFAVGLNAGYAHSSVDLVNDGRVKVDGGNLGFYATYFSGGFYLDAAVGGGWNSYNTRRSTLQNVSRGESNGAELNGMAATGYDWKKGNWSFGPGATFQYAEASINSFRETYSLGSLEIVEQSENAFRSTLGAKVAYDCRLGGVTLRPDLYVGWLHAFGDESYPLEARFASGAGNVFTVRGPALGRDQAIVEAGVTVCWSSQVAGYLSYQGKFSGNRDSHGVGGGLRVSF